MKLRQIPLLDRPPLAESAIGAASSALLYETYVDFSPPRDS